MANPRLNKTRRYSRHAYGDDGALGKRNILAVSFVATDLQKPIATSNTAVHAAITASDTDTTTVTTGFTQPDVPRNLIVKPGGTAGDVKDATDIVVTGTNVEGKTITETFTTVADTVTALTGSKAFATVTSIAIPAQDGAAATFSVGVGAKLGIGLRNLASMPIKVMVDGVLEDASASAFSTSAVESNTVTPTTAANGSKAMRVYVLNYKFAADPTNGNPDYGV